MTYKVYLDGDNLVPHLTGQAEKSPREPFLYINDDQQLVGMRYDNWKWVFMEQRAPGTLRVWAEPFTTLRIPKIFNLRIDPYERADITSNTYDRQGEARAGECRTVQDGDVGEPRGDGEPDDAGPPEDPRRHADWHVGRRIQPQVKEWLATAKHPRWKKPYTETTYLPMQEVLTYLRANGYKTYIVTGGGQDFVRVFSEATYGIPPEQVDAVHRLADHC